MKKLCAWLLRALVLVVAVGIFVVASRGTAADEKEVRSHLNKLADALEKNQPDAAKPAALALQKPDVELDIIMEVFKLRSKGGLGLGPTPRKGSDGIEKKIQDFDK